MHELWESYNQNHCVCAIFVTFLLLFIYFFLIKRMAQKERAIKESSLDTIYLETWFLCRYIWAHRCAAASQGGWPPRPRTDVRMRRRPAAWCIHTHPHPADTCTPTACTGHGKNRDRDGEIFRVIIIHRKSLLNHQVSLQRWWANLLKMPRCRMCVQVRDFLRMRPSDRYHR